MTDIVQRLHERSGTAALVNISELLEAADEIERLHARFNSCTGYFMDTGLIMHDGDTCPIHEHVTYCMYPVEQVAMMNNTVLVALNELGQLKGNPACESCGNSKYWDRTEGMWVCINDWEHG